MNILIDFFQRFFSDHHINLYVGLVLTSVLIGLSVGMVSYSAKKYLVPFLKKGLKKARNHWLNLISAHGIPEKLAKLAPALLLYWSVGLIEESTLMISFILVSLIKILTAIYMLVVLTTAISSSIDVVFAHYQHKHGYHQPLKAYPQILKIILWFLVVTFCISIIVNKSPWTFLTGLGAVSALFALVFKDTLLGLAANIQISAYDLVRIGDWITLEAKNIDGTVLDIFINTVKIRNFDNTLATLPTYDLISCSVQNWRGMTDSGARRIKRAIKIDASSISRDEKNTKTNLYTFREYIKNYLKTHEYICKELPLVVRNLPSTESGLPVEIYAFIKTTDWNVYEDIVADIFEHLIAVIPQFGLRIFQIPSGVK